MRKTYCHVAVGVLWTLGMLPVVASASDWPTYLHDNTRGGATDERLALPLQQHWKLAAPGALNMAWSGPNGRIIEGKDLRHRVQFDSVFQVAVAGNRMYFGSSVDHSLSCVDVDSGRRLWQFFADGPIRLAPTVWQDIVLFGSDDGLVYALRATSGALLWKRRGGPAEEWLLARGEMISRWPIRTGVLVEAGVAYFGAGIFPHEDVYLYAVRPRDGSLVWQRDNISESDAGRNDLSPQGYLLATSEKLVVPSGRSLPGVFNRLNGEFLHKREHKWRREAGGVVGGTRALLADGQLYAAGPHHMLALDEESGDVGFGWFEGRQMAVSGDDAFVATGDAIVRIDRAAYAVASRERQEINQEIYNLNRKLRTAKDEAEAIRKSIADLNDRLKEIADVGIVWRTPSACESALIVAGQHVIAGGRQQVVMYSVPDGQKVWSAEVDAEASGLAVAHRHVFVSTTAGSIYAFGPGESAKRVQPENTHKGSPFPDDAWTAVYRDAAQSVLRHSGVTRGFCLVLDSGVGRLAAELALQSDLRIYCVESDAKRVAESRRLLSRAGLYGHRIVVHHGESGQIPYSNYFANLVVSDRMLRSGRLPDNPGRLARHVKPLGGVVCVGTVSETPQGNSDKRVIRGWFQKLGFGKAALLRAAGTWTCLTRGALPGAGDWSHQYGDSGNTASTDDTRVQGGLGVLWYGDPGPGKMVNRHEGAVGPLAVNGRLIVEGQDSVLAYDAYNGAFLWEHKNPQSLRTGVFQNYNPGNLVASQDSVFVMEGAVCTQIDAASGQVQRVHRLPPSRDGKMYSWGYLAYRSGLLFGTATMREELQQALRRRGRQTQDATDAVFCIDVKSGRHVWLYEGQNIVHRTIALGPDRVFFIDSSISSEQRAALLKQDKQALKKLSGEQALLAEQRMKNLDARLAVALDSRTGKKLWSQPVDVTDCSEIGTGGGKLTLLYKNNTLLLCGANANGHYWKQFMDGEFSRRRLVALSAADGAKLWARDANYRHRPIVVEDRIIAEPWAFDLYSGEQLTRSNPLTGQSEPWSLIRPGHHCGMMTGCPGMLIFRSGYTGFYDLKTDAGTRHFSGHRLGCWINAIPANGLVMIPEASAGCVCLFSIASTITLEPRQPRRPWTLTSSVGATTPVQNMALNLGAPGDRKDALGTVWLAYPRPDPHKVTGLDLKLALKEKLMPSGAFTSVNSRDLQVAGSENPWLYASAARGISELRLPLIGEGQSAGTYTVKLYFSELDDTPDARDRRFSVKLQGRTVLRDFNILQAAGKPLSVVVRQFGNLDVTRDLRLEMISSSGQSSPGSLPTLNAIEVQRTDAPQR